MDLKFANVHMYFIHMRADCCPFLVQQSVATSVALHQGLSSPLFAVAVCFSVIVMYDAAGVRRHAGKNL